MIQAATNSVTRQVSMTRKELIDAVRTRYWESSAETAQRDPGRVRGHHQLSQRACDPSGLIRHGKTEDDAALQTQLIPGQRGAH